MGALGHGVGRCECVSRGRSLSRGGRQVRPRASVGKQRVAPAPRRWGCGAERSDKGRSAEATSEALAGCGVVRELDSEGPLPPGWVRMTMLIWLDREEDIG